MRFRLWTHRMVLAGAALLVVVEGIIILNLARLNETQFQARLIAPGQASEQMKESLYRLKREARTRASLYEQLIQANMLSQGLVIHRDYRNRERGLCDSLLFSALRFRALQNLGMETEANAAWKAIDASRDGGFWWRHPYCRNRSLSRDMLMGVMMTLDTAPSGSREALIELLREIDQRGGSFSDGPFFVSYLSPGPAGLLRHLALSKQIPFSEWPWVLKQSFSSIEFDAMFLQPGYQSHLAALGIWLEYQMNKSEGGFNPRSALGQVERLITGAPSGVATTIDRERLVWVSSLLLDQNPSNLFFEYLHAVVSDSLTDGKRAALLTDLLNMKQFPTDKLPRDCDRSADYLWQRRVEEYVPEHDECRETYAGVDFLWMAGLLVQDR